MTNEQIRDSKKSYTIIKNGWAVFTEDVVQEIQNETRADERLRLINEIDVKCCNFYIQQDEFVEVITRGKLTEILNELKK